MSKIKSKRLGNDHARLYERLECRGFSENKIKSDGNCQFRSIADQLFQSSDKHNLVRQEIVKQLKSCPGAYKGFVTNMDNVSENRKKNRKLDYFHEYVNNMAKNSVWGDNVTLKAAADAFKVKIVLITSYEESSPVEILPKSKKSDRVIYLSFLAEYHYNSIHLKQGSDIDTASMDIHSKNKKENTETNKKNKEKTKSLKKKK